MSCLQAIGGEDTENPFICHIINLLWLLSDKGTHFRFCWIPSHCGIEGNAGVDQLAKETLDQNIDPLASLHYTGMKPSVNSVNSYIQKLVQTNWDVAVHGWDLYLVKPTLGPPKKFQHLTGAKEVVITRLRIGHTKATKSHILSRVPPPVSHHCFQTLTIDHILLQCAVLQEYRDEYYTVDSLNYLFETILETCMVEFLRGSGFFFLIWWHLLTSTSTKTWTIWSDISNIFWRMKATLMLIYLGRMVNISHVCRRQTNPIQPYCSKLSDAVIYKCRVHSAWLTHRNYIRSHLLKSCS